MDFSYSTAVARLCGSPLPAIYLEALRLAERERGSVVALSPGEIAVATGIAGAAVSQSRTALVARGFVEVRGSDGRRVEHVIRHDTLESALRTAELAQSAREASGRLAPKREPEPAPPTQLSIATGIDIEDVRQGRLDALSPSVLAASEALHEALVAYWAKLWGKRVEVTASRRQAMRALFVERRAPSQVVLALDGMREDDYERRVEFCEPRYLLKAGAFERFVARAERVASGAVPSRRGITVATKTVGSVVVPADYVWTSADDYAAASGRYSFDLVTRKWKEKGTPDDAKRTARR